jgi:hypothetical protein
VGRYEEGIVEVVIDPDVRAVAEFIQSKIEARKLVGVAESLRAIAPILWSQYHHHPVQAIELRSDSITCESQRASIGSASKRLHVGDSVAAGIALAPQRFRGGSPRNGKPRNTA